MTGLEWLKQELQRRGCIDRRKPTPAQWIHVEDEMGKVYKNASVSEKTKLEGEVFRSAYDNLDDEDKATIKSIVGRFNTRHTGLKSKELGVHITNFGELAALETLAKLGIWLNAVGR